jgi:hypothetical protein
MQKFRRGDEWWGFHPDRGWLRWDATVNDWLPQVDGPVPWVKSPFKRRAARKLSRRQAALETLTPANEEETRLLAHVLAEPAVPGDEGFDRAALAERAAPIDEEGARLLTHVLTAEPRRHSPTAYRKPRPRKLVAFLWVARAIAIAGGAVLLYVIGRAALAGFDVMFLPAW